MAGDRSAQIALGAGTSWSFKSLPAITFTKLHEQHSSFPYNLLFNFAVDSKGGLHAVFNNDGELGYAVATGGAWKQEVVLKQVDNRNNTGFEGHLALEAKDQPFIAASNSTHHSGWSIKSLQLFYHGRKSDGTWSAELIADKADGYVGGDGNKYTGFQVQLAFNAVGHPYVAFSDLASWHITYNYRAPGQIRYAIKACGKWHHHTVFKQKGQTVSPNPIYACRHPMLTLGHDGQTMLFACVEHVIPDPTASATTVTANLRAIRASQLMK